MLEAWELGLGEPVPVSAEHGQGLPDLRDAVVEALGAEIAFGDDEEEDEEIAASEVLIGEDIADPDAEDAPSYDEAKPMRIAVVGRPNAGKSTMINALIGEERLLTGPEAGITRDSISVDWNWRGRAMKLFDTAGMRRKARVQEKLEKMSVQDGLLPFASPRSSSSCWTRRSRSRSRTCRSPTSSCARDALRSSPSTNGT
jgi:GTP-binding protein